MTKKKICLYTKMLNRLNMLDEHMFEMQTALDKVREMISLNFDTNTPEAEEDAVPEPLSREGDSLDSLDRLREMCLQTTREIDLKKGDF